MGIIFGLAIVGSSAHAATRSMTGSLGIINPSVAAPFFFESGPAVAGRKAGPYAPNTGFKTVDVAGTATGTSVGRPVTLAAGKLDITQTVLRDFPAFNGVANLTRTQMSVQSSAFLAEGLGALAACPGPGCTSAGSGTAISWCPPLAQPPTPAPGTAANQVGNWDCPSWPAGAGGGDRFLRIGISNTSGRNNFGGTLLLLRNVLQNVWRVLVQPGTDGIAEVSRAWAVFDGGPEDAFTPGRPNFDYTAAGPMAGPRILARLNTNGAVTQTLGCVNGVGTPGGTFMLGDPIYGVGSNCGTPTIPAQPVQGWGFALTTGDVEGSDPFPFGLVITSATPPGTPFAPNIGTQPTGAGFFFTRMGTDAVTGTQRNLVLVGGGVAIDPPSGNAFFRIMDLRLKLQPVPEPAAALGLLGGASALALTVSLRRRRSRR
jgi:hypothetical protein